MKDGYPTRQEIKQVKAYSGHLRSKNTDNMDPPRLIELLQEIWAYPDYIKKDGRRLELHTGGWSGNEEIIKALQGSMFWLLYWQKSERGGHYYFELPEEGKVH